VFSLHSNARRVSDALVLLLIHFEIGPVKSKNFFYDAVLPGNGPFRLLRYPIIIP